MIMTFASRKPLASRPFTFVTWRQEKHETMICLAHASNVDHELLCCSCLFRKLPSCEKQENEYRLLSWQPRLQSGIELDLCEARLRAASAKSHLSHQKVLAMRAPSRKLSVQLPLEACRCVV